MTGGIIQLVSQGDHNIFLTHKPQITLFKTIYRRHTNFSVEQIPQDFISLSPNFNTRATCELGHRGDMIGRIHLLLTLPRISSLPNNIKVAWMRKIGFGIIKSVSLEIGGKLIDKHYGEWLYIMSEIFNKSAHYRSIDNMIGNIKEVTDFTESKEYFNLYIPLQFWFCRNNPLPLLALQYNKVKITVEFNDIKTCLLVSPTHYIELYNDVVNYKAQEYIEQNVDGVIASGIFSHYDISNKRLYYKKVSKNDFKTITTNLSIQSDIHDLLFDQSNTKYFIKGLTSNCYSIPNINTYSKTHTVFDTQISNLSISNCSLLVDYYYLDIEERNMFYKTHHKCLIEQLIKTPEQTIESTNTTNNIEITGLCKLLVWIVKQDYLSETYNSDIFNYTDSYIYNNNKQIGKSLVQNQTIKLNSVARLSKRDYKYFNHIQPTEHNYEGNISEGINMYSFSLDASTLQPNGVCNMGQITNTQLDITVNNIVSLLNKAKLSVYSWGYNILEITNGYAGLLFSNYH